MGIVSQVKDRWQEAMADPLQKQAFEQFALALMQSKPGITPFENLGSAIESSQAYMMQMRELDKRRKMEADMIQLERDKLGLQGEENQLRRQQIEQEGNYNTGRLQQDRRDRISANAQGRLNRQSQERVAGMEVQGRKDVETIKNTEDKQREFAITARINQWAQDLMEMTPGLTLPEARARVNAAMLSVPSGALSPRYGENNIIYPTPEEIQQQTLSSLTRPPERITPNAVAGAGTGYTVGQSVQVAVNGKLEEGRIVQVNKDGSAVVQSVKDPTKTKVIPAKGAK